MHYPCAIAVSLTRPQLPHSLHFSTRVQFSHIRKHPSRTHKGCETTQQVQQILNANAIQCENSHCLPYSSLWLLFLLLFGCCCCPDFCIRITVHTTYTHTLEDLENRLNETAYGIMQIFAHFLHTLCSSLSCICGKFA